MRKVGREETEFGGGSGLVDSVLRANRVVGQERTASGWAGLNDETMEIYATNPADPESGQENSDLTFTGQQRRHPVDPSTAIGTS